jgi:hypothetical protein
MNSTANGITKLYQNKVMLFRNNSFVGKLVINCLCATSDILKYTQTVFFLQEKKNICIFARSFVQILKYIKWKKN